MAKGAKKIYNCQKNGLTQMTIDDEQKISKKYCLEVGDLLLFGYSHRTDNNTRIYLVEHYTRRVN